MTQSITDMWTTDKMEAAADEYAYETGWALYHPDIRDAFLAGCRYILAKTQKETSNERTT